MTEQRLPLLQGVVGSTAYGLSTPSSDVDRLGIFTYRTEVFFNLSAPKESVVSTKPDSTWHEAAKALKLILACNPTATEILWLESYETATPLGKELVSLRSSFLSAKAVRNAYLGYATQQFRKLQAREVTCTAAPSRTQSEKHARHLYRLLTQGTHLHQTGELMVRLEDPDLVREMGCAIARDPDHGIACLANAEMVFDGPGVLPDTPDTDAANAWLRRVRLTYLDDDRS